MLTALYTSLKELFVVGIAYYVFWRYAHFTEVQAMILALMAGVLVSLFAATRKTSSRFEPFFIRIEPQWFDILHDQQLVDNEKWKSLNAHYENKENAYSVLRDGIAITALGQELYYSHNHKTFSSKLDLSEPIPEFQISETRESTSSFTPRFYVKLVLEKYSRNSTFRCIQFGLVTVDSLKKSIHPADDRANIPLATLPYAIFNCYNNGYFALDGKLKEAEIERLLKEYGWEHSKRNADDHWLNLPFEINHKYVRVLYDGV